MASLSRQYYAFGMRRAINFHVSGCGACRLNAHPRCRKEDDGEHIATEPNAFVQIDYCGPWAGFSGTKKYYFLAVDCASRYCFTTPTSSTSDAETLRSLMEYRRHLCGFPAKVGTDNAILTSRSRSRAFLEENHVSIVHGHAHVSRSQSKAEKTIGTISRLMLKYQTDRPRTTFTDLVHEATITYNSSPNDALPRGLAPRDVHFARPPVSFLRSANDRDIGGVSRTLVDCVGAARTSGRETLQHDVAAYLRRQQHRSPTNFTLRLQVGDLCLKKRTTWPVNTPRKLGYRIVIDAFKVLKRIATNTFLCASLLTGDEEILPGDHLVRVRGFDETSLRQLCVRMEEAAMRSSATIGPRMTRSRTAAATPDAVDDSNVASVQAPRGLWFHRDSRTTRTSVVDDGMAFLDRLYK